MYIGVVFPQTEIGNDPSVIRDYAQTAEGLGYSHILAYDHVLGASVKNRPDWRGPYTSDTPFHEPFVLFGYMASITERIGFTPGAAPDCAGRQASGSSGPVERRAIEAGRGHRLERGRVRGAWGGVR
jgi:hypothetical protein